MFWDGEQNHVLAVENVAQVIGAIPKHFALAAGPADNLPLLNFEIPAVRTAVDSLYRFAGHFHISLLHNKGCVNRRYCLLTDSVVQCGHGK